jgi:putative transposase
MAAEAAKCHGGGCFAVLEGDYNHKVLGYNVLSRLKGLKSYVYLFIREIIGWSMRKRITKDIVIEALAMAMKRKRPHKGLIFHSDRGSQYASHEFIELLEGHDVIQSMSGKGNCYDTLKTKLVYFEKYRTRTEARWSIFEYVEIFYNRIRKHSYSGYVSPVDFGRLSMAD